MRVVILGGGPCGLGAARRLQELGHSDWLLCERNDHWGGLAASFEDEHGFWWDVGGHVLFSHYPYFDKMIDGLFEGSDNGWEKHGREAWVWMQDRFVPYPLQSNIHALPEEVFWECLEGIIDLREAGNSPAPENFGEFIEATFGKGLAKWFLRPYNFKVWAYPPEEMSWSWVGERVTPVDLKAVLRNAVFQSHERSWGPNASFRFPKQGATGAIWRAVAEQLPKENLRRNCELQRISTRERKLVFSDGSTEEYDYLLSTIPLTELVTRADLGAPFDAPPPLRHSATHIVGLGLNGTPPEHLATKCWLYFPEDNCPFYRVTVFSNYAAANVPDSSCQWSLMCEVSESPMKPVDSKKVVEDVVQGALNTGLIASRRELNHTWSIRAEKGYPTPSLTRNELLFPLLRELQERRVYSRGRFGAWRYEVGNMDHSFMQGVEFVDSLLEGGEEVTLWHPEIVNAPGPPAKGKK